MFSEFIFLLIFTSPKGKTIDFLFIADGNQFFNRPGPRLIESLEIFAEIIHPNIFDFEHKGIGWINYND